MRRSESIAFLRTLVHIALLRPLVKLFLGVTVRGGGHLRHLDKYIIVANHNSHVDILLLFCLLPVEDIIRTHPVAEHAYFSRFRIVFHLVNFLFRPIWITRGRPDLTGDPLGGLKRAIDEGENVIVFPEGTRGEPGKMQHFKSGIGRLVVQYPDVPIVPVYLSGPERALPKRSILLLPFWNYITIGPPQSCRGTHREITHLLERILIDLSRSDSAGRHHRSSCEHRPPRVIAFLGIDGSGKSTLSRLVAEKLSESAAVCLVSDRLDFYQDGARKKTQPLAVEKVREMIGAYAKSAKSLKLYKIPKLTELLLRNHLLNEVQRWYLPDLIVMDGHPLLNMVAWAALYAGHPLDGDVCSKAVAILTGRQRGMKRSDPIFVEFRELRYMDRFHLNRFSLPDRVMFLDIAPASACARIAARGENRQVHETHEKLEALRGGYLLLCKVIERDWQIPTCILDAAEVPMQLVQETCTFLNRHTAEKDQTYGTSD